MGYAVYTVEVQLGGQLHRILYGYIIIDGSIFAKAVDAEVLYSSLHINIHPNRMVVCILLNFSWLYSSYFLCVVHVLLLQVPQSAESVVDIAQSG